MSNTTPLHSVPSATAASAPTGHSRRVLPPTLSFVGTALAFAAFYVAAGAPTPLLVLFQQEWGFPALMLTVAFGAYAIGLLAALLVAGRLSDHIGRRPVLIGSLVVELIAMVMFIFAPDIGWVIVARIIQGVATGVASSAFSASVIELAPPRYRKLGAVVGAVAPAGGLGLGALLTGVAVQFTSNANLIVFTALAGIMVLGTLVAIFSNETVSRRPGLAASFVPRIAIPRSARREFFASIPVHVASWMLAGFFIGLVPTIIREVFHLDSGLLNGATAFLEPAAAAVIGLVLGGLAARRTTVIGTIGVLIGAAIIVLGITLGILPLLWLGGIVGGVGFGASFSGSLRQLGPLVEAHERGALFAGVFVVAYLAFGIPAIVVGLLVAQLGLVPMVIGYATVIVIVAAFGLVTQLRAGRR